MQARLWLYQHPQSSLRCVAHIPMPTFLVGLASDSNAHYQTRMLAGRLETYVVILPLLLPDISLRVRDPLRSRWGGHE